MEFPQHQIWDMGMRTTSEGKIVENVNEDIALSISWEKLVGMLSTPIQRERGTVSSESSRITLSTIDP